MEDELRKSLKALYWEQEAIDEGLKLIEDVNSESYKDLIAARQKVHDMIMEIEELLRKNKKDETDAKAAEKQAIRTTIIEAAKILSGLGVAGIIVFSEAFQTITSKAFPIASKFIKI